MSTTTSPPVLCQDASLLVSSYKPKKSLRQREEEHLIDIRKTITNPLLSSLLQKSPQSTATSPEIIDITPASPSLTSISTTLSPNPRPKLMFSKMELIQAVRGLQPLFPGIDIFSLFPKLDLKSDQGINPPPLSELSELGLQGLIGANGLFGAIPGFQVPLGGPLNHLGFSPTPPPSGFPLSFPFLQSNLNNPPLGTTKPTKPPRNPRNPYKKIREPKAKKMGKTKPEITGPPFQLDYAPHLRNAVTPFKRTREESPDIIILDEPIQKKPHLISMPPPMFQVKPEDGNRVSPQFLSMTRPSSVLVIPDKQISQGLEQLKEIFPTQNVEMISSAPLLVSPEPVFQVPVLLGNQLVSRAPTPFVPPTTPISVNFEQLVSQLTQQSQQLSSPQQLQESPQFDTATVQLASMFLSPKQELYQDLCQFAQASRAPTPFVAPSTSLPTPFEQLMPQLSPQHAQLQGIQLFNQIPISSPAPIASPLLGPGLNQVVSWTPTPFVVPSTPVPMELLLSQLTQQSAKLSPEQIPQSQEIQQFNPISNNPVSPPAQLLSPGQLQMPLSPGEVPMPLSPGHVVPQSQLDQVVTRTPTPFPTPSTSAPTFLEQLRSQLSPKSEQPISTVVSPELVNQDSMFFSPGQTLSQQLRQLELLSQASTSAIPTSPKQPTVTLSSQEDVSVTPVVAQEKPGPSQEPGPSEPVFKVPALPKKIKPKKDLIYPAHHRPETPPGFVPEPLPIPYPELAPFYNCHAYKLPDSASSRETPESSGPVITPNQAVYVKLQQEFPQWRYHYFMQRALRSHTRCLMVKRMEFMVDAAGLRLRWKEQDSRWKRERYWVYVKLTEQERKEFSMAFLKNCVEFGKFLDEKQKEMNDPVGFFMWMQERAENTPEIKPYYKIHLPTFKTFLDTITEVFSSLKLSDCSAEQKQHLINMLQYDWTSPQLYPQRIQHFSKIIKLSPQRITRILEEARKKIKQAIWTSEFYWSVDYTIPPFFY